MDSMKSGDLNYDMNASTEEKIQQLKSLKGSLLLNYLKTLDALSRGVYHAVLPNDGLHYKSLPF